MSRICVPSAGGRCGLGLGLVRWLVCGIVLRKIIFLDSRIVLERNCLKCGVCD